MKKAEKAVPDNAEPVAAPDHTERIKSQVVAEFGGPPRLYRVAASRHHKGNDGASIGEEPDPIESSAVSIGFRIRSSYYLKVPETGKSLTAPRH